MKLLILILSMFLGRSQLSVVSPSSLKSEFQSGQIHYTNLLYGNFFYNQARDFNLQVLSDEQACSKISRQFSSSDLLLLPLGECYHHTKLYQAQRSGAGGVILANTDDSIDIRFEQNSQMEDQISIFGLVISQSDAKILQQYSNQTIQLNFLLSIPSSYTPQVSLGLSGNNHQDLETVRWAFRYFTGGSYQISLKFHYQTCEICNESIKEKYCVGDFCMIHSQGDVQGKQLVESSILHECNRRLMTTQEFLTYLLKVMSNCPYQYIDCINWVYSPDNSSQQAIRDSCIDDIQQDFQEGDDQDLLIQNNLPAPGIALQDTPVILTDQDDFRLVVCEANHDQNVQVCQQYCDQDILFTQKADGVCQDTLKCQQDLFDCQSCNTGCSLTMVGDGQCQVQCQNQACNFDQDDCVVPSQDEQTVYNQQESGEEEDSSMDLIWILAGVLAAVFIIGQILFRFFVACLVRRIRKRNNEFRNPNIEGDSINAIGSNMQWVEIQMPRDTFTIKQKIWGDTACSICLGDFEDGQEIRRTRCSHCFHRECIDHYIAQTQHASCPNCRANLREY